MRRTWILGAVVGLLMVACGAAEVSDSTAPQATPTTEAPTTTTTTSPEVEVDWGSLDVIGPEMSPPGHFRTFDGFVAPFHAAVPETVQYLDSSETFTILIPSEEEFDTGVTRALLVVDMGLGSAADTIGWFESEPSMTTTARDSVEIGGVEAVTFDVTTPELVTVPDSGQYFEPEWIYRPAILELGGVTVTVIVEAHEDVFEDFWNDVQPMVQSITWAPEQYVELETPEYVPAPGTVEDGLDLTIELEIPDPAPDVPTGPFTATGTAVDAGWLCAEGTYTQLSYAMVDEANLIETWEMQLACDVPAGSITVTVEAQAQDTGTGWYSDNEWTITAADGQLAGATGLGGGFSECGSVCLDVYEGRLLLESATYLEIAIEAEDADDFDAVFAASGTAVDNGVLCAEGTVLGGEYNEDGWPVAVWTLGIECETPEGAFTVDVVAEVTEEGDEFLTSGTWTLTDPSGSFAGYSGGGDLSTVCADGWCVDDYFGWLIAGA